MICAIIIAAHAGGSITDAAAVVRWAADARCEVRIEGVCASSCAMLLAVGCVTPGARIGFHAPNRMGTPLPERERALWAARMAAYMPPAIGQWYVTGPARQADPVWITGETAIKAGARAC
jgi:hypothetical protein